MRKTGKVWGETTPLLQTPLLEVHKVTAMEGGFCSKHKHERRWNAFYVTDGELLIRCWKEDYPLVDETVLMAGEFTTVPPGEWHQFEVPFGNDRCEFIEIYYLEPMSGNDIVRDFCGGTSPIEKLVEETPNFRVVRARGGGGGSGC